MRLFRIYFRLLSKQAWNVVSGSIIKNLSRPPHEPNTFHFDERIENPVPRRSDHPELSTNDCLRHSTDRLPSVPDPEGIDRENPE